MPVRYEVQNGEERHASIKRINANVSFQLILLSGFPTSGKSTRAKQLYEYLAKHIEGQPEGHQRYRLHLISDQTLSISRSVYDLSPEKLPAHTRSANASEKDARAALYGAVKRVLSPRDIVILDGLNYIKGWRYQLYCEAKNLRTPNVVLQIGCSVNRARSVNEERLRQREERLSKTEDAPPEESGEEGPEEPYEPSNWDNLVFRYEEPNPMTRWDSPLFALVWEDDEARTKEVFDALWEAIAGESRKVIKPNQAAAQRGTEASGDYLSILERETQDIVKKILDQQGDENVGGQVRIPRQSDGAEDLLVELPGKKVGLAQLQRYRRAYMGLNRGGIGLEGVGTLTIHRIREGFVGYLNDAFEKEE
jgi:protein KTI12